MLLRRCFLFASTSAALALVLPHARASRQVALTGILGRKALLAVDGSSLQSVGEGETYRGVKVIRIANGEAIVEVDGVSQTLRMGHAPVSIGGGNMPTNAGQGPIVLMADARGHFTTELRVNQQLIPAMVDTGASTIAIGRSHADRLGLSYQSATPVRVNTANGIAQAWPIKLERVAISSQQFWNVDAMVLSQDMPFVLLGNSFLGSFNMTRNNDQMVLVRKP